LRAIPRIRHAARDYRRCTLRDRLAIWDSLKALVA